MSAAIQPVRIVAGGTSGTVNVGTIGTVNVAAVGGTVNVGTVTGTVNVIAQNSNKLIQQSGNTTGHPLLPAGGTVTGGTGSYLDSIIIIPATITTVGSSSVQLADNLSGTVTIFPALWAGTTTLMNPLMFQIFIGAVSQNGPWRITIGANSNITAIGNFKP